MIRIDSRATLTLGLMLASLAFAAPVAGQFQLEDPTAAGSGAAGEPDEDSNERSRAEQVSEPEEATAEQTADAEEREDEDSSSTVTTTTFGPSSAPESESEDDSFLLIPPVLLREQAGTATTVVFPFFFRQAEDDDEQIVVPPYYYRRSPELNVDVLFPIYWSFRGVDALTFVVPPFYYDETSNSSAWGVPPLLLHRHDEESAYTVIPPLLTFTYADEDEAYTFAGLFWRIRDEVDVDWGLFPLLWVFDHEYETDIIAPPFLFRLEDADEETALTVVPPVYVSQTSEHTAWGIAGLLHIYDDAKGGSVTIPPLLFHLGEDGDDFRLVTPLFGYFDVERESTLITPLYQNHRGETLLDAVAPFFFWSRNHHHGNAAVIIPPLLFGHVDTPASSTTVSFPFFARWHEHGRYTTWLTPLAARYQSHEEDAAGMWIFPTIQVSHDETSSTFNIHPLVYSHSADTHRHFVLTPLIWDFEDYEDDSRATVLFPIVWRFREQSTVSQLVLNTYYHEYRQRGVHGWEFHFFPFFAYGEPRPGDHWWSIFYGLAGYRRSGPYAEGRAFWIPFEVDSPE